ncbi:MAG TPA: Ppx/GppA phosphatase family protein [Mariprofundaceae bacterium]|nr:Ppx/GppA phosphatase family protein [Mariprofundaceae bacterium]
MNSADTAPPLLAAVIDIGSNAIRLRIGGADSNGGIEAIHYHREPVRLGSDAFSQGTLSDDTIDRAVEAFHTFRSMIDQYPVKAIRATGTSALRSASNAARLVKRVKKETDIRIEVISGEEEARLIHAAVRKNIDNFDRLNAILIDIGGGSVEITLSREGEIVALETLKMGTVRLLEMFNNVSHDDFTQLLNEYILSMHQKLGEEIHNSDIDLCIGTGGNIESLGGLSVSELDYPNANRLDYKGIKKLCQRLSTLSYSERVEQLQLRPDRADVVVPAALVLKSLMKRFRPADLIIPGTDLATGVLIDLLYGDQDELEHPGHQALAWGASLARRFHADLRHAEHVRFIATELCRQLAPHHGLTSRDDLLLQMAALLHEVGMSIRPAGHHRHAHYIIHASPMIGISSEEKALLATIVRYHRKRFPDEKHTPFSQLDPDQQKRAEKLIVILRMAIALNKERRGNVRTLRLLNLKSCAELRIEGEGDLLLEVWAARKSASLYKRIFGQHLQVTTEEG